MGQRKIQVIHAKDKPWPEGKIYVTAGELAKRYEVIPRTIRRWLESEFLPLNIDSQMKLLRWDIEELQEFEDGITTSTTSHS